MKKLALKFLKKIIEYPNEAIHDGCVVVFTGAYEKIAIDNQTKRELMWIRGIPHDNFYK